MLLPHTILDSETGLQLVMPKQQLVSHDVQWYRKQEGLRLK